jgi:hypothetical protein
LASSLQISIRHVGKEEKSSGHIIMTDLADRGRKEDLFEKGRRRPFFIVKKVSRPHLRRGAGNTKH